MSTFKWYAYRAVLFAGSAAAVFIIESGKRWLA